LNVFAKKPAPPVTIEREEAKIALPMMSFERLECRLEEMRIEEKPAHLKPQG
jgi:hypothetical protein